MQRIVRHSYLGRLIKRMGLWLAVSLGVLVFSILGLTLVYYVVEGDQGTGKGLFDWFYFTVITTRTIGFGDITPKTNVGKLITIFNALLPASLFMGASLVVLENIFAWLETVYRRHRMQRLEGHHLVVADPELMESIVQEHLHDKRHFLCIHPTRLGDLPQRLQNLLDDTTYYNGDPTRDEVLRDAGVERAAAVLIATADDSANLYVLVSVKGLAPGVKTVVRVNRLETESKFRSVGADVLLPAGTMMGRLLSQAAAHPVAQDLLVRLQTGTAAPSLVEHHARKEHLGAPAQEAFPDAVALYRDGAYLANVAAETLRSGDVVLAIDWGEAAPAR